MSPVINIFAAVGYSSFELRQHFLVLFYILARFTLYHRLVNICIFSRKWESYYGIRVLL